MDEGRREGAERSRDACPACGAHRLTVIDFPDVPTMGVQPYSELLGMGELHSSTPPGIGCLECGAHWSDVAAFRAGEPPIETAPEGERETEPEPQA